MSNVQEIVTLHIGYICPCLLYTSHEKSVQNIVVCKVSKKSVSSDSRFARGIPVLLVRIPMLLGWFTAVSYTHLDVYKRQAQDLPVFGDDAVPGEYQVGR